MGMLCNAHKSMKLFIMRNPGGRLRARRRSEAPLRSGARLPQSHLARPATATRPATPAWPARWPGPANGGQQIIEIDLARALRRQHGRDDESRRRITNASAAPFRPASTPAATWASMPTTTLAYFSVTGPGTAQLSEGQTLQQANGQRNMGAGPSGLRSMNLKTGEVKIVCNVGFQIGHVQTNPVDPRRDHLLLGNRRQGAAADLVCQCRRHRPAAALSRGTLRMDHPRSRHQQGRSGHRDPGSSPARRDSTIGESPEPPSIPPAWASSTFELARCGSSARCPSETTGRSDWHVAGSPDGRWAVFDDFQYRLWLIDRHTGETVLLADLGHKTTASDHVHPTFSLDSTKIEVQCAMLAPDNRSLDICVVPVPKSWLDRTYSERLVPLEGDCGIAGPAGRTRTA